MIYPSPLLVACAFESVPMRTFFRHFFTPKKGSPPLYDREFGMMACSATLTNSAPFRTIDDEDVDLWSLDFIIASITDDQTIGNGNGTNFCDVSLLTNDEYISVSLPRAVTTHLQDVVPFLSHGFTPKKEGKLKVVSKEVSLFRCQLFSAFRAVDFRRIVTCIHFEISPLNPAIMF